MGKRKRLSYVILYKSFLYLFFQVCVMQNSFIRIHDIIVFKEKLVFNRKQFYKFIVRNNQPPAIAVL